MIAPARTALFASDAAALLVVDMQNDFCAEGGYVETVHGKSAAPCRAIVPAIAHLVAAARAAQVPVVWIAADYTPEKLPPPLRATMGRMGGVYACRPGTWGYDFHGLRPAAGETIVVKHSFDGFLATELEATLRLLARSAVVVTGVQTHVCVDMTAKSAVLRGFHLAVPADAVASHTPDLHDATLKTLGFAYGDVTTSDAVIALWSRPAA
jgi:ureidoacrylate peracid hydrolase